MPSPISSILVSMRTSPGQPGPEVSPSVARVNAAVASPLGGRLGGGFLVERQPVARLEAVEHVHDLELEAAGLVAGAVPQGDDPRLERGIEHDQGAIAFHPTAMGDDPVAGIIVDAPAQAI